MPKLIMLKGNAASGKSTWAKTEAEAKNYVRISKDDIRADFVGSFTPTREKLVLKIRDQLIRTALRNRKSVIVDDTNLNPIHERALQQIAQEEGARFEINDSFLQVSPQECIKRDLHRGDKAVGASVIWGQYYKWIAPRPLLKLHQNFGKPRAVICDLDGTLCWNQGGRSYYDMTRVDEDSLNPFVGCVVDALYNYGQEADGKPYPSILLVSGRSESAREATEKWLERNLIPYDKLIMRQDGDTRADEIVKEEIYHQEIEPCYTVLGVIDDRPKVARMWRGLGLIVLQAGTPELEF